jgi:hypothetical protein
MPNNLDEPSSDAAMNATGIDRSVLDQVRRAQTARRPGTLVFAVGFPLVFLVPVVGFTILFFFAGATDIAMQGDPPKQPKQKQVVGQRQDQPPPPVFASLTCCSGTAAVPILWIGGAAVVLISGLKLNSSFKKRNTVTLQYALEPEKKTRFNKLLKRLDKLASVEMFEIVWRQDGYHHGSSVRLRLKIPAYLECNVDIYCLETGGEEFYLFPDCVLLLQDTRYYILTWHKVTIGINNVHGLFHTTDYHLQWAHSRVDGGPDRRHKYNWQYKVPYAVQRPIQQYGVISFKVDRMSCVILVANKEAVLGFDTAVIAWQR